MKYKRFEELPVWQAASDLAERVFVLSQKPLFRGYGSLRNQLESSMLSISNNIAERFERGSTQELINFVHIARGSAGEVRSMLILLSRMAAFATPRSEILDLKSRVESISRQLRGWVDSLQNTSIKGPRYLNDKVRQMEQRKRERDEFLRELRSNLSKGSP
ncbi:MAG: four helix bundle protein [Candidatus Acidiferrales bacterium]